MRDSPNHDTSDVTISQYVDIIKRGSDLYKTIANGPTRDTRGTDLLSFEMWGGEGGFSET